MLPTRKARSTLVGSANQWRRLSRPNRRASVLKCRRPDRDPTDAIARRTSDGRGRSAGKPNETRQRSSAIAGVDPPLEPLCTWTAAPAQARPPVAGGCGRTAGGSSLSPADSSEDASPAVPTPPKHPRRPNTLASETPVGSRPACARPPNRPFCVEAPWLAGPVPTSRLPSALPGELCPSSRPRTAHPLATARAAIEQAAGGAAAGPVVAAVEAGAARAAPLLSWR
mmetsp:Transcript_29715/g.94587  ORF Transcript_29715/g.94587 Transcript_29715/m.94587 type:complete len:226 (-) Transcript_29715:565-1242(-)